MPSNDPLGSRIHELHYERFKAYETEVLQKRALKERAEKNEKARAPARHDFLKRLGLDYKLFEAEEQRENEYEGRALEEYLSHIRPELDARKNPRSDDARWAAIQTSVLCETKKSVLTPYAAGIYAADPTSFEANTGESGNGAIDSGWIFPDDTSRIRIVDRGHVGTICFEASAAPPPPEFSVQFAFVPASTATYEMTAVMAFHGFYILRSNDSFWNCRHALAKLNISMNVNQYVDLGWKNFPALINRDESNIEELAHYDSTQFFDYTATLRGGDPVVVTVKGRLRALGIGGHTYAELNFAAGTANYIWPLFLSLNQA